jgi:nitrogen-specific signal transduction histidine kinase
MATLHTYFAPAERADNELLESDISFFASYQPLRNILNAVPSIGLILNEHRQIVFSNNHLLETVGVSGLEQLMGKRPGEVFNCVNATLEPGGCATSEFCQVCGAARVIIESLASGQSASDECRITSGNGKMCKAWDFRCVATPFNINQKVFTILSLSDISHEKRRRAMERIFFHDIINTASGLEGFLSYISKANRQKETMPHIDIVRRLSRSLIDEITAQRELNSAENDELIVRRENAYSLDLVSDVVNFMAYHIVSQNKNIITCPDSDNIAFQADATLLRRVLINMLKNALEACAEGEEVSIGCRQEENTVIFWVRNPGTMPRDVQKQIFQRSFSTKGQDRGLGTYSMRLLTEKYLGGKISFTTSAKSGTAFMVRLPIG